MSVETRKELAVNRLKKLVKKGLMPCVLEDFEKEGSLYYSERSPLGGILYWANEMGGIPKDVQNKIKELEEKYDITIYHITHEYAGFGELWDFWCVTDEDVEFGEEDFDDYNITYAYVYNRSDDWCSEFGSIDFRLVGGGAIRGN